MKLLSTKFDVNFKFNQNKKLNILKDDDYKSKFDFANYLSPYPIPPIPKDYLLEVKGYGAGHGVGMSQWGAKEMAERGKSFRKILQHYYSGVQIKTY